jgi:hypothetical protein
MIADFHSSIESNDAREFDCREDWIDGEYSSILALFDHLIRPLKDAGRNRHANLLSRLQIDH